MTAPGAVADLLPLAWAALVLVGCWRRRPAAGRLHDLVPAVGAGGRSVGAAGSAPGAGHRAFHRAAEGVGRRVRALAGRPPDPVADGRVGLALLVALPIALAAPPIGVAVAALAWGVPGFRARAVVRRREAAVARELPEVVDLLALAVGAGLTVSLAVGAVGRRAPGVLGAELARVAEEVALGRRLADALGDVPGRAGEATRPVVAALVDAERYGAPLLDQLDRLAAEVRAGRRRAAEEAARRVPVKLLFPLVLCTLPAFGLLTVAPLLAGAARTLRP